MTSGEAKRHVSFWTIGSRPSCYKGSQNSHMRKFCSCFIRLIQLVSSLVLVILETTRVGRLSAFLRNVPRTVQTGSVALSVEYFGSRVLDFMLRSWMQSMGRPCSISSP